MASPTATDPSPRQLVIGTALVLIAAFAVGLWFHLASPVLHDTDAYFHLAVAREMAARGGLEEFPWARFSLLRDQFGDKELGFHWLLAPFAGGAQGSRGGRIALALLDAALLAAIGLLAAHAVGVWGFLLPAFLVATALDFSDRVVRLRPELLALLLLLGLTWAAGRGRGRLVGLLALVFTLSYTAFQALAGLLIAWFAGRAWGERRWDWGGLSYGFLGIGLGLVLHPRFPVNLVVWAAQNIEYYRLRSTLDVGIEIHPTTTAALLLTNFGWWLGAWALWRSARPRGEPDLESRGLAWTFGLAAGAFAILYLLMWQFGFYFFPLASLAILYLLRAQGRAPGAWVRLPGRGRVPLAAALGAAFLLALPNAWGWAAQLLDPSAPGPPREVEWATFGRALPEQAKVAAPWGTAQAYLFFAPQARYLNFLDSIFMALPYPREHELQREIFAGREPDPVLAARLGLDSDYLAFSRFADSGPLPRRLAADPRAEPLHAVYNFLYRTHPGRNGAFVLDWRVLPEASATSAGEAVPYPRLPPGSGGAWEAYVDLRRLVDPPECVTMASDLRVGEPSRRRYEFAPYGAGALALDGQPLVRSERPAGAVLGEGLTVEVELAPGDHRFTVDTCRAPGGHQGFYLLVRDQEKVGGDDGK